MNAPGGPFNPIELLITVSGGPTRARPGKDIDKIVSWDVVSREKE